MQAVLLAQLLRDMYGGLPVEKQALFPGLPAINDILRHGAGLQQHKVLLDHADLLRDGIVGRAEMLKFSVDINFAGGGLLQPVKNFHQRGLTGTVLSYHCQNLTLIQREMHIVIGVKRTVYLGNVFHFQQQGNTPGLSS